MSDGFVDIITTWFRNKIALKNRKRRERRERRGRGALRTRVVKERSTTAEEYAQLGECDKNGVQVCNAADDGGVVISLFRQAIVRHTWDLGARVSRLIA